MAQQTSALTHLRLEAVGGTLTHSDTSKKSLGRSISITFPESTDLSTVQDSHLLKKKKSSLVEVPQSSKTWELFVQLHHETVNWLNQRIKTELKPPNVNSFNICKP